MGKIWFGAAKFCFRLPHSYRLLEKRYADDPLAALQQLVRNALIRRCYENTHAVVKVNWFVDRIEIWSSGGAFGAVNAVNFEQPSYADYRNPHIAEAMKGLGLVQRFGAEIQTAKAELKRNGNPSLVFRVDSGAVNVTIKKAFMKGRRYPILVLFQGTHFLNHSVFIGILCAKDILCLSAQSFATRFWLLPKLCRHLQQMAQYNIGM